MNSINLFTSNMRISGLASGMDTEQIISNLMRIERAPLDRLYQKKQLAEWKRDQYRDIINLIRSMKDEYFDILKPANYLLSNSAYKKFSAISSDSSIVTASANTDAMAGTYEIVVHNLATAAEARSQKGVTGPIEGTISLSETELANIDGKNIVVTLDGVTKTITIGSSEGGQIETLAQLRDDLQKKLNEAFGVVGKNGQIFGQNGEILDEEGNVIGSSKIIVGFTADNRITFQTTAEGGATRITLGRDEDNDGLYLLGISNGASNRLNTSESLESFVSRIRGADSQPMFDNYGNLTFSINSQEFTFSRKTSISAMLNSINSNADAKVNIIYDEVTDNFILTAKQLGAGNNLNIEDSEHGFFKNILGIDPGIEGDSIKPGVDAKVEIGMAGDTNKTVITRGSNEFTVNGIMYSLQKADPTKTHTIQVETNVDGIFDTINSFVNKYNELIDKINGKLKEKYDRNYLPLTEEEKKAMSEKDIELWEEKAKTGLLRNDSILEKMVLEMRKALYDSIEGVGIHLTSIGITTGSYEQKGKLVVNENELKKAIKNNPEGIMELFNKRSEKYPSYSRSLTTEEKEIRYKESGIAQRIYDIIEDNISTFRDKDGNKGFLLEKAGLEGDASEFTNSIYKEIKDYQTSINELYKKLIQKENSYFRKFTAMEEALSRMNAQSNWLYAQLSALGNS
jgi:flagellar hook-associated protein 2